MKGKVGVLFFLTESRRLPGQNQTPDVSLLYTRGGDQRGVMATVERVVSWMGVARGQISKLFNRLRLLEQRVKRLEDLTDPVLEEEVEDWT